MFVVEVIVGLYVLSGWVFIKYFIIGFIILLVCYMVLYLFINNWLRLYFEMER